MWRKNTHLGGGNFKYLLFSPQNLGEMIQFSVKTTSNTCHSTARRFLSRNDVPSYNLYITADDRQWPLAPTVVSNSTSAAVPRGRGVVEVKPNSFPKKEP